MRSRQVLTPLIAAFTIALAACGGSGPSAVRVAGQGVGASVPERPLLEYVPADAQVGMYVNFRALRDAGLFRGWSSLLTQSADGDPAVRDRVTRMFESIDAGLFVAPETGDEVDYLLVGRGRLNADDLSALDTEAVERREHRGVIVFITPGLQFVFLGDHTVLGARTSGRIDRAIDAALGQGGPSDEFRRLAQRGFVSHHVTMLMSRTVLSAQATPQTAQFFEHMGGVLAYADLDASGGASGEAVVEFNDSQAAQIIAIAAGTLLEQAGREQDPMAAVARAASVRVVGTDVFISSRIDAGTVQRLSDDVYRSMLEDDGRESGDL